MGDSRGRRAVVGEAAREGEGEILARRVSIDGRRIGVDGVSGAVESGRCDEEAEGTAR